jgi:exopolyphosphatase/guanosine-5'-triphosphate,3'-diphosphate pyrophosphatase
MPIFAAVDIGSNSVRLKVARLVRRRLHPLYEDREVTRLGEAVFRTGLLAPAAMAHTIKVLQRFHRAAQKQGADRVRVVATSALRDARNAHSFREWVRAATGWQVEVVTGLDEARLIHLAILSNSRLSPSPVLLMDLGGGSCELTVSRKGHIQETVSLPLGAVRLTREFLRHDPPKKKEMARMRKFIAEEVGRVAARMAGARAHRMIATSGTAAALSENRRRTQGKRGSVAVSRRAAIKMAAKLSKLNQEERQRLPGIGTKRTEIIVAGATVFAEVMERCGLPGFRYSPLGLRDGLLAEMAAEHDRRTRSRRQIESDRRDALVAMGARYQADPEHARQVQERALELFGELRGLHQLPAEYEEWLSAAAMLHEVGGYVNRAGRHRHTYYIIAHSEIFGYTQAQRRLIAAIARYLGKSRPAPGDRALKLLPVSDREPVRRAVVLLRLAAALDQGRRGVVKCVRARVKDSRVTLALKSRRRTGADLELWALAKERGYFREVFGRELAAALS